jgi:glycosyltransferase involved in cell wall biosynthesis
MQPLVSILVPCYNYAHYLAECLDSIFAQQGDIDFELILIDDRSTDNTWEILSGLTDPRVRVLRNETNQGHGRTIETALRAARGKLVARIDPDDRLRPEFLELTTPIFEQHPDVGLVYGDAALIDTTGRQTAPCSDRQHGGRVYHGNELVALLEHNFICAPTVIARRECWLNALPVPTHLAFNDWYFTTSIAREWNFYFRPVVLAEYRVHATNLHSAIARDGREERSVRWVLDQIYATPEKDALLEQAKQNARGRIYARQLIDAAEKYFWFGNYADARRCYLNALRDDASQALKPAVLRHLLATLVGRRPYESVKRVVHRVRGA